MLVELVSLLNDDGLRLDGAFYPPTKDADRRGPVDAVLLIHGSRGNFYDGATKSMAEEKFTQALKADKKFVSKRRKQRR